MLLPFKNPEEIKHNLFLYINVDKNKYKINGLKKDSDNCPVDRSAQNKFSVWTSKINSYVTSGQLIIANNLFLLYIIMKHFF